MQSQQPSPEGETKNSFSAAPCHLPCLLGIVLKLAAFSNKAGQSHEAGRLVNGKIRWKQPSSSLSVKGQDFWNRALVKLFLFFAAMGLAFEDSGAD